MDKKNYLLNLLKRSIAEESIKKEITDKIEVLSEEQVALIIKSLEKAEERLTRIKQGQADTVIAEVGLEKQKESTEYTSKLREKEENSKQQEKTILTNLMSELESLT